MTCWSDHELPNFDADQHSRWWLPPSWPGKRRSVVSVELPQHELTITFAGGRGSLRCSLSEREQADPRVKLFWLHFACRVAVEHHAALHLIADDAEQIEMVERRVARRLPRYGNVRPSSAMCDSATLREEPAAMKRDRKERQ
jgi:hypothetical protein